MKNKNVEYVRIQKGNLLLLVPTVRVGILGSEIEMLWSLKEFDYKVFGYLDVEHVISSIINEKAVAGLPFYDIDMDMYDPNTYPDTIMESLCKVGWDYAVMRLTHLYFDQLIKNYPDQTPSNFAVTCQWHSNTHEALQIHPLNDQYQSVDGLEELKIGFSSYSNYSEELLEELVIKIGKCEKIEKSFTPWNPEKFEYKKVMTEQLIKRGNSFFLFHDGEIHCGMDHINPNILLKCPWRLFAAEMIHAKGCKECNPGYKMRIEVPMDELILFKHSLNKDYWKNVSNDCYSISTQLINIINSQWKRIQEEHPEMEKIVFSMEYDDQGGKKNYIIVQYLDKNWQGPTKEIIYKHNGDYIINDKESLANAM